MLKTSLIEIYNQSVKRFQLETCHVLGRNVLHRVSVNVVYLFHAKKL